MKQLVVISGKGGTGKTVIAASFAALAKNKVMADCDVDAANLHLLLHPSIKETYEFRGGKTARIDKGKCTQCEECIKVCRFGAISKIEGEVIVDPISCEGCGVCFHICPTNAVQMEEDLSGEWFISDTMYGPFVHARLAIASENSGKLVTIVRQNAKSIAEKENKDLVIVDGPPGIGCPVIASLAGVDLALVVTEPTLSGIHDMERIIKVAHHFGIKTYVCINKYDLNLKNTQTIRKCCQDLNIEMAGEVAFDPKVTEALVNGKSVIEYQDSGASRQISNLWNNVSRA